MGGRIAVDQMQFESERQISEVRSLLIKLSSEAISFNFNGRVVFFAPDISGNPLKPTSRYSGDITVLKAFVNSETSSVRLDLSRSSADKSGRSYSTSFMIRGEWNFVKSDNSMNTIYQGQPYAVGKLFKSGYPKGSEVRFYAFKRKEK